MCFSGTHSELVNRPEGAYAQLVQLQQLKDTEQEGPADDDDEIQYAKLTTLPRSESRFSSGRKSGSASFVR